MNGRGAPSGYIAMTRPRRYVLRMAVFLVAVAALIAALGPGLRQAFLANPGLNGLIVGVFVLGVANNIRQVLRLNADVAWIEHFRERAVTDAPASPFVADAAPRPALLAPMAAMLGDCRQRLALSPLLLRSLLDGVFARLDESRDLSRYIVGLMIFLGLLGTFWGLALTVGSVGQVIGGLQIGGGDPAQVFETLKSGLAAPLSGMGTAFSSSLFGLAGSLVLGFLDLQTGQAQNRFFNETEEWLSGLTRLPSGGLGGERETSVPAYVQALLEQTAEALDSLQQTLQRGEDGRQATNAQLRQLTETLAALSDQMRSDQAITRQLIDGQSDLKPLLARIADGATHGGGIDDATRAHVRNLDVYVARLIEELIAGREEVVRQIRSDIRMLARTIAASASDSADGR